MRDIQTLATWLEICINELTITNISKGQSELSGHINRTPFHIAITENTKATATIEAKSFPFSLKTTLASYMRADPICAYSVVRENKTIAYVIHWDLTDPYECIQLAKSGGTLNVGEKLRHFKQYWQS